MTDTTPVVYDLGTSSEPVAQPEPERVLNAFAHIMEQSRRFLADPEVRRLLQSRRIRELVERATERVADGQLSVAAASLIKRVLRAYRGPRRAVCRRTHIVRTSGLLPTSGRALRGPTALVASIPATGLLARTS